MTSVGGYGATAGKLVLHLSQHALCSKYETRGRRSQRGSPRSRPERSVAHILELRSVDFGAAWGYHSLLFRATWLCRLNLFQAQLFGGCSISNLELTLLLMIKFLQDLLYQNCRDYCNTISTGSCRISIITRSPVQWMGSLDRLT